MMVIGLLKNITTTKKLALFVHTNFTCRSNNLTYTHTLFCPSTVNLIFKLCILNQFSFFFIYFYKQSQFFQKASFMLHVLTQVKREDKFFFKIEFYLFIVNLIQKCSILGKFIVPFIILKRFDHFCVTN